MVREPADVNALFAEDTDDQSQGHEAGSLPPAFRAGVPGRPPPRATRGALCLAAASAAAGLALAVRWRWRSRGGPPHRALLPRSGDLVGLLATGDVNFSLARLGTGCDNWRRIGIGETVVTASANQCAGRCHRSVGCLGFNWQPGPCKGGEQVQRGACILFRSVCIVENNSCWDLYDVGGISVQEEYSEGTLAETSPSSMSTTDTLPAETTADDPESQTTTSSVQTSFTLPAGTIPDDPEIQTAPSSVQRTFTLHAGTIPDDPEVQTTPSSVQRTFTLPAGTIPEDPEIQAAVLSDLEEMLTKETGAAHVSVSLKQEWGEMHAEEAAAMTQQARRLNVAAPEQEVEVTFTPGSPELAAMIEEQRDALKSKMCETAEQTVKGGKDKKVSTSMAQDLAGAVGLNRNQLDTIIFIILGVLGILVLCGCVACGCVDEDKKKGHKSPRGSSEQLVPLDGGIVAGADEQATELQHVQKLPVEGFGDVLAETDLVQGAAAGATALPVRCTHGFCRGDRVQITSVKGSETKVVCGFDETTGSMLVYTGLFYTHAMGAVVSKHQTSPPALD